MEEKKAILLFITLNLFVAVAFPAKPLPDSVLNEAKILLTEGRTDHAKSLAHKSLEQALESSNDSLEAASYYWIANAFQEEDNHSVAATYYQRAIENADLHNFKPLHARALTTYGAMLATINEVNLARANIELSLKLAKEMRDLQLIAGNQIHLSHLAHMENNYKAQMESAGIALSLGRQLKDTLLIAMAHMNMGSAAYSLENYESAEKHLRAAAEYFLIVGNTDKFALAHIDLINLTRDRGGAFDWKLELLQFQKTLSERNIDVPDEYLYEMLDMLRVETAGLEKDKALLIGTMVAGTIVLLIIILWLIRYVAKTRTNTQVNIEITMEDRIRPLYGPKDNMLVVTYALLASGMPVSKIAETVHKDRTTVYHWIKEIESKLGIENAREDARKHGRCLTKNTQLIRNINPN